MDDDQSESIPEGALLSIANNILDLLDYSSELENEEDLFLDDFYIAIVSNLVSDRKFNIVPGKTKEEKVKSLDNLIQFLSQIIEMDFSQISAKGIIFDHDRVSTKCLLELIEELIKALIEQGQNPGDGENEEPSEKTENSQEIKKQNISDGNLMKNRKNDMELHSEEIDNIDDDIAVDISSKQKEKKEEINENDDDIIVNNEISESGNNKDIHMSTSKNELEGHPDENEVNNEESSEIYLVNRSALGPLEIDKIMRSEKDNSYVRQTMSQNDITRYERQYAELENENENLKESDNDNEHLKYGGLDALDVSQNLPETPIKNVSHISEVSKSKENSEQHHKLNSKKKNESDLNSLKQREQEKDILVDKISGGFDKDVTGSYVSYHKESELNEEDKDDEQFGMGGEDDEEELKQLTGNSIHSAPSMPQARQKIHLTSSENSLNSYNDNEGKNDNIITQSEKSVKKSERKSVKTDKSLNENNNDNNISQSDISKSSIHTGNKSINKSENKQTKSSNNNQNKSSSSSILEELPLSNEQLQFEIMKELRRIYGNKFDRILLNYNAQNSQGVIDLILRNIKLARQKTMKIANRIPDPDDLVTKEFIHRYNKELQYILKYYKKEKMQRNMFQERALKTMTQNVRVMKKIQEIQTKKVESEIERKRKAREVRNHHNQLRLCNEVYAKAFQYEKEKYLEETANQMEIRRIENEEKRRNMMEIEKFYKDKIAILNELLRREKRDREIEHRAKIQFLSQLEREKKGEFRKQIDEVLARFDEEDKRAEIEDNNQEEIEKIFNLYYKK